MTFASAPSGKRAATLAVVGVVPPPPSVLQPASARKTTNKVRRIKTSGSGSVAVPWGTPRHARGFHACARSIGDVELEVFVAVDRLHLDLAAVAAVPQGQRYLHAGAAERPQLPVEAGEVGDRLPGDGIDDVAVLDPGLFRRPVG